MENNYIKLYTDILKDLELKELKKVKNICEFDHMDRIKTVKGFLRAIVCRVGCNDYLFTRGITELDKIYGKAIVPELWEILDTFYTYNGKEGFDISRDEAFAAYYCLIHHYYRNSDTDNMKTLLNPKSESKILTAQINDFKSVSNSAYNELFANDYPLVFELLARYYAVRRNYNMQLIFAKTALKKLEGVGNKTICSEYIQQGINYGVGISLVGAVCSILEVNYLSGNLTKLEDEKDKGYIESHVNISNSSIDILKADMSLIADYIGDFETSIIQKYINDAMVFSIQELKDDYPKYHYLKAKSKFYFAVMKNFWEGKGLQTLESEEEILGEIDEAIRLEKLRSSHDVEKRTHAYNCLTEYVNGYKKSILNEGYHEKRYSIISAKRRKNLDSKKTPALSKKITGDYVFISYSSLDFKQVYCDLLKMENKGINYWYDKGTKSGQDWKETVHQYIRGCSVVIYYLSMQSIASDAVMEELNFILQLGKPVICINLCGYSITSKTLINIIRESKSQAINQITSNTFKTLCTACPDYVVTIQRDADPLNVYHIDKLHDDLLKTYPNVIRRIKGESSTCSNNKSRPNEDFEICDNENRIYIVADGITRRKEEYDEALKNGTSSIAKLVSECFCNTMHRYVKEMLLKVKNEGFLLRDFEDCFKKANQEVENYLTVNQNLYHKVSPNFTDEPYFEKPGCVAIAAFILNDKLYYGSVGDCMGILIRGGRRIIFSDKQTEYVFKHLQLEDKRGVLYESYVNKSDTPHGYGVVNGDEEATKFFGVSHFDLEVGDRIFLASDGVSDFIEYGQVSEILSCRSAKEILEKEKEIEDNDKLRAETRYKYDDKTIIRIDIN